MPSWLNEHHIKGAHAIKESSSLTKKRFIKNLYWQACMMPFKCLYPLPKDNRLTIEMIMQSINASVQCEIKKRGAYLRACWPYPVSPSSSTWSASPPDSASLQECCSPLRGNRVEAGDEGLVLAHHVQHMRSPCGRMIWSSCSTVQLAITFWKKEKVKREYIEYFKTW